MKTVSPGAGVGLSTAAGVSNASPPVRMDAIVCVFSVRPLALTESSTPLAFQKRVSRATSFWYGASTKTYTESSSRSASSV